MTASKTFGDSELSTAISGPYTRHQPKRGGVGKLHGLIFSLSALDYLGFGLPPTEPSWGNLLQQAKENWDAWWIGVPLVLAETYSLIDSLLFGLGMWKLRERGELAGGGDEEAPALGVGQALRGWRGEVEGEVEGGA